MAKAAQRLGKPQRAAGRSGIAVQVVVYRHANS
jgi:hypothetical protein